MNENILIIDSLSKFYKKTPVLKDVSLSLNAGKVVGLCGPNGAGKTTLIKIIVGLLRDYEGQVLVDGKPLDSDSRAKISYLPDVETIDPSATGYSMSSLYQDMYEDFDINILEDLFIKLHLDGSMPIGSMSKGMREKFQLALCLSRKADIYILDEPIAGVDPASRDLIIETIIENYTKDALLLISTHLIQDVEFVLEEVIFLKEGEVILHENCDVLREQRNMGIDEIFREEFKW